MSSTPRTDRGQRCVDRIALLDGAARTYPGPPAVHALRPTDLVIRRGDYLAITGTSGSGKSTLLNVLGLLDRVSSGRYVLADHDIGQLSDLQLTALRSRLLGFVFQAFHLLDHRTALENVALPLVYQRVPPATRHERALAAVRQVGLLQRAEAHPSTMSGGEQQRVAIARAIVSRPQLLLCDEPTGNLDSDTTRSILDLLDDLNRSGLTIVMVTHESDVAARARRSLDMNDGHLRETGG